MPETMTATTKTLRDASCADDYDPNSMPVAKARELIRTFLTPMSAVERVHVRSALGRVLATDVISPIAVPGHDNSAMDGYAVRFADLKPDGETVLKRVGESFAGKPWAGTIGPSECVRIFTGGVMPQGADSVVMQERASEDKSGVRVAPGALAKAGTNRRFAGEDLKAGQLVFRAGQRINPAELGMIASLGIGEVGVYRRLRVAFFSTGDELKSIGTPLAAGEIYDSNRYTLHGMLTRLGCEVLDMGVVEDEPKKLESAFSAAAQSADVVITSGGVSVGEADYVKQLLDKLGEVLFWKIAMHPSGRARRRASADLPCAAVGADSQGARPHRIPARHPVTRRRRRLDGAHHRRPGVRNTVVDVAGELLHHPRHRHRQRRGRRAGRRAAFRGDHLAARTALSSG
jgi:molybdopterin molybdotransferase